jgi:hypothetical protein
MADSLRERKGVQWATAKLETADGDGTYVEFFRGKDFARYFQANPDKLSAVVPLKPGVRALLDTRAAGAKIPTCLQVSDAPADPACRSGRTVDDQIAELMMLMMRRRLVQKTERKFKKPKPGRTRLVKFPRTLVRHPVSSAASQPASMHEHHR